MPQGAQDLGPYGGGQPVAAPTGWFRLEEVAGRWWLVDPEGRAFLSIGVNNVSFRPDHARDGGGVPYHETVNALYRSPTDWANTALARLRRWGFNTLGARSSPITRDRQMAYTVLLDLASQGPRSPDQPFPDVFDRDWQRAVQRHARQTCRRLAGDPWLIGYFTDDQLWWGDPPGEGQTLLHAFLALPDHAPGRRALLAFLHGRYDTLEALNEAWRTGYERFEDIGRLAQVGARIPERDHEDFQRLVADQYLRIGAAAVRAADPNHLVLGCRLATPPPPPVLAALAEHVDLVSLNHYELRPDDALIREVHRVTGLPILITEFSVRAADSGLPNTLGPGPLVENQERRAELVAGYVRELISLPSVVGYHWFQYVDQPAEGRLDGQDGNYGLVTIRDEPYHPLVEAFSRVNREAYAWAAHERPR